MRSFRTILIYEFHSVAMTATIVYTLYIQFAMDENKIQQNLSILNLFLFLRPVKRDEGKKSVETVRKHGKLPYRIYRQR